MKGGLALRSMEDREKPAAPLCTGKGEAVQQNGVKPATSYSVNKIRKPNGDTSCHQVDRCRTLPADSVLSLFTIYLSQQGQFKGM